MTSFKVIQEYVQNKDLEQFLQLELIGELAYYVEENNLPYEELAKKTGVSEEDISDLLEGCIHSFEIISKLIKALDLKINLSLTEK